MKYKKNYPNDFKGKSEFERYLAKLRVEKLSERTIKKHRTYLSQALRYINKKPKEITIEDVDKLHEEISLNRPYEKDTIFAYISILRKFLRYIENRTADKIKLPSKTRHLPPEKEIWLLVEEEKAIIQKSKEMNIRAYAIVKLLLSSGIRAGELINIDITDINWEDNTIHIKHGKGDKSRYVCFDTETREALNDYLIARIKPRTDKNALFTSHQQKRISYEIINKIVKECAIQAGITKPITPHKLRHTFITNVIEKTMDIPLAQKLAGHTEIATTMRYHHTQHETIVAKYKEQLDNPKFSKDEEIQISDREILRKLDVKYLQGEIPKEFYFKLRNEYSQGLNSDQKEKRKGESTDVAYR